MSRMTAAERQELAKLVRLNAKVAKDDADARGKWLLADAEAKLSAVYKAEDEAWADITAEAKKAVAEADATIAALCRERGIPEDFRPALHLGWIGRGENAAPSCGSSPRPRLPPSSSRPRSRLTARPSSSSPRSPRPG